MINSKAAGLDSRHDCDSSRICSLHCDMWSINTEMFYFKNRGKVSKVLIEVTDISLSNCCDREITVACFCKRS